MTTAKDGNKPLAAEKSEADSTAPLTAQDVRRLVEEILSQHQLAPRAEIISFDALCARVPISPRSIRTALKSGRIPHIRLPGARRLLFDWETVLLALRRFEKGGPRC